MSRGFVISKSLLLSINRVILTFRFKKNEEKKINTHKIERQNQAILRPNYVRNLVFIEEWYTLLSDYSQESVSAIIQGNQGYTLVRENSYNLVGK